MPRAPATLTIGTLARSAGVSVQTIRYYERIGVMPAPPRSHGGQRQYDLAHMRRLGFIRRGRELGFSLDEIRGLLRLVDGGAYSCGEVKDLMVQHLEEVRVRIAALAGLERRLAEIAARCGGGPMPDCPIIDALLDARPGPEPTPPR